MLKRQVFLLLILVWCATCGAQENQCIKKSELLGGTSYQLLILDKERFVLFTEALEKIEKGDYSPASLMLSEMLMFFDTFNLSNAIFSDTINWFCDWKNIEGLNDNNIYCIDGIKKKLQTLKNKVVKKRHISYEDKMRIIRYCLYWSCLAINKETWYFHPQLTFHRSLLDSSALLTHFIENSNEDSFSINLSHLLKYNYYPNGTLFWHRYPARIFQSSLEFALFSLEEFNEFPPSKNPVCRKMELFIQEMLTNITTEKWIVLEFNWFTS